MFLLKVIFANLTNQNCKFVSKRYSHLQGLHLPDKSTDGSKAIEILVGLNYYFEVIKGKFGEPVTSKSSFGYILSGHYKSHSTVNFNEIHLLKIHTETDVNLQQQSFNTNVTKLFNEAYYDESIKERSYLISEFQKVNEEFHSAKSGYRVIAVIYVSTSPQSQVIYVHVTAVIYTCYVSKINL